MNLKRFFYIPIIAFTVVFTSCFGTDNPFEYSDDARFVSLSFMRNDSIPGLDLARFTLAFDEEFGDSIIVNLDSLRFGIRIDSVFPMFQFRSSRNAEIIQKREHGNDTIFLFGNVPGHINDTINFTFPTWVQNRSADGENVRTYRIKVNVHQVEPELYVWQMLNNQITSNVGTNQRAVFFKNRNLFYVGTDAGNFLHTTADENLTAETVWQPTTLTFTPQPATSLRFRHIVENQGTLFVADNANNLYSSIDGKNWSIVLTDLPGGVYNLLFSVNDNLWAITRTLANEYQIVFSENGGEWTVWDVLPEIDALRKFPVSDFASLVFRSPVGRPRIIIVGGYDRTGQLTRANWIGHINFDNEMIFMPLTTDALEPLHSASIIQYDNRLLLFGGMDENGHIIGLRESRNEGRTWITPNPAFNSLPAEFMPRTAQSVLVNDDRRIFLIGGRGTFVSYSDVWTVKLNRMYWTD